jgi:hypothetical protein
MSAGEFPVGGLAGAWRPLRQRSKARLLRDLFRHFLSCLVAGFEALDVRGERASTDPASPGKPA